jgi:UDP-GlcNAc3NAcA epimerase
MKEIKIATIVGARPQFIKAAVVSKAIKKAGNLSEVMIHTGQHYDARMSTCFFEELEIPEPQYSLSVGSGMHGYQTGEMMKRIEPVLIKEKPEAVVVYGDTNTTLAGAIVAAKLHIPVAHIEAGLRSCDKTMPEEINRITTDHVSSLLFCPTKTAMNNLKSEGIRSGIYKSGDVMYDVAIQYGESAARNSKIMETTNIGPSQYILATVHRAENTDEMPRMTKIMEALNEIAGDVDVIMPLHPRTGKVICSYGIGDKISRIRIIEPVGFLDMMCLIKNARAVVTDSGGLQKEAYFHRVPCVTLREQTEWIETIDANWNVLADLSSTDSIVTTIRFAMMGNNFRFEIAEYGDGKAADQIVKIIAAYLNSNWEN